MGSTKFFCTWDIGELIGPQQVRVIDRCKSHFKLSQVCLSRQNQSRQHYELRHSCAWHLS